MDTLNDVWKEVLSVCKNKVSEVMFNLWIKPLELVKFENNTFIFLIGTEFKKTIVMDKFYGVIKEAFEEVMGFPVEIDILVNNQSANTGAAQQENEEKKDYAGTYTFDNFIVGKSNFFAYNVSLGVVANPGKLHNPLMIYGRSGLGKTHLMLAIEHDLRKNYPDMVVIYTTGEDLMNEFINGLKLKNTTPFREKYRNADALLVDDIQSIAKSEATQDEFFYTFDALKRANKQIVLTSDQPPRDMTILTDRLRSRFEQGILADVQAPDFETRKAIILTKCEKLGILLDDEIVDYIAQNIKGNIRQLEGAVNKIYAMQLNHQTVTIEDANNIIKDVAGNSQPVTETVDKIISFIAKTFGITEEDIKSEKRQKNVKKARQVAMYVIKEVTDLNLKDIGNQFGKNHSTVIYSIDQVKQTMETDPEVRMVAKNAIDEFKKY